MSKAIGYFKDGQIFQSHLDSLATSCCRVYKVTEGLDITDRKKKTQ